ncbi:MAG: HAMP domain-containing protein, partial [Bacteroidales bacterium]|nr:HAMP domain-containing protein [Bacteroidales bacterium]
MKIQTKLGIFPITLAIIMLIVSLLVTLIISNSAIKNHVGNQLLTTAQSRVHNIETLLNDCKNVVRLLAVGIPFTNVLDPQIDYTRKITECNLRIKRTIDIIPYINRIRILNKNGIVIASSNENIGFDQSEKTFFIKGRESTYIGEFHKSVYTGNLVLSISTPIYVRDIFAGVLVVNFDVENKLFEIMVNRIGLGKTGEIYLVNKDGYIITPSGVFDDATILETKTNTEQVNLCILEHIGEGFLPEMEEISTIYTNYTGRKVLGTHYFISEMQWGLIAELDVKEANKPMNKQAVILIIIFSILLITTLLVIFIISKNITSPIVKLQKGTEEIIKGNLDHKIGVKSKDEIGQLSRSFDTMTDKLRNAQNKLKNYTEDLETTVNERTAELKKQFEKSEKQRIATLVVLNDLNATTKELKAEITERKRAEEELDKYREHLEELVKERTQKLEEQNKELARLNHLFVN